MSAVKFSDYLVKLVRLRRAGEEELGSLCLHHETVSNCWHFTVAWVRQQLTIAPTAGDRFFDDQLDHFAFRRAVDLEFAEKGQFDETGRPPPDELECEINRFDREGLGAEWLDDVRRRFPDVAKVFSSETADEQPQSAPSEWTPKQGYVGALSIRLNDRFGKNGVSPPRTTVRDWEKADACDPPPEPALDPCIVRWISLDGTPVPVYRAPNNREIYYPESWVHARIAKWNPRISNRNRN